MVYGLGDEIRLLTEQVIELEKKLTMAHAAGRKEEHEAVLELWINSGIASVVDGEIDYEKRCRVFWDMFRTQQDKEGEKE